MNKTTLGLVLAALALGMSQAEAKDSSFAVGPGENAIRVSVKPVANRKFTLDVYRENQKQPLRLEIAYPGYGWAKGGILRSYHKDISWDEFCDRQRNKKPMPEYTDYSNALVTVSAKGWFGMDYSMLPFFAPFSGLYRRDRVARDIDEWLRTYPLYPEHTFTFEFRYDAVLDRLEGFLDGAYAGHAPGAGALARVVAHTDASSEVEGSAFVSPDVPEVRLKALKGRAHELLKSDAKLVFAPGGEEKAKAVLDIWDPAESVDQGRHRSNSPVRSLVSDPEAKRTPWKTGPEFMQWTVPNAFYRTANVLCADIPAKDRKPVIGLNVTRFGVSCDGSSEHAELSLENAATKPNLTVVGELEYKKDGETVKTPLYLARVRVNPFTILQYVNDLKVYGSKGKGKLERMLNEVDDYLDVEFVGCGTWRGFPRSSVQIFGCSLERMDYSVVMDQSVRGNLFVRGEEKPETGVKVTAERDGAKGTVEYRIFDPLFKTLEEGRKTFEIAKKGETTRLSFDLDRPDVGWYGIDFTFRDADGRELGVHEASYTILAADDREAGCESPFAAWPLGNGYHNSDPNPRQQAEVMRKAGYRASWQPPCEVENEYGFPLTCSNLGQGKLAGYCNPCSKRSAEALEKHLDMVVKKYRESLAKFPSCRYIQLLHEQGGRDVDACLYDPRKACTRGEYKGIDGPWDVYFCTEFAKRMRKEFPNLKIFLGNGSVSSEKVADLVRRGFDLSLVDQLGIESKGFQTMPELAYHREAPGCLWALGETARYFGYSNLTLNACNEYVFRPERRVDRKLPAGKVLEISNYAVRDALLSLAHGCGIISSGHLEDCNDQYYDTPWGCGGQCTFYPFSYPKRMYTGFAVMTRAMDKATFVRAVPNGGNATYTLEFKRDRKTPDFAYAMWTCQFPASIRARFPEGTKVRVIDFFGTERELGSSFDLEIGPSPRYLVAGRAAESMEVLPRTFGKMSGWRQLLDGNFANLRPTGPGRLKYGLFTTDYGCPTMPIGQWTFGEAKEEEFGSVTTMDLVRKDPAPSPLLWEAGELLLKKPITVPAGPKAPKIGLLVKGNGGCGCVALGYWSPEVQGPAYCFGKTLVSFDGWQLVEMTPPTHHISKPVTKIEIRSVMFGTGRKALNPVEMADVTNGLRFGGIYIADEAAKEFSKKDSIEEMKRGVSDKDL